MQHHQVAKDLLLAALIMFCGGGASLALGSKKLGSALGIAIGVLLALIGVLLLLL